MTGEEGRRFAEEAFGLIELNDRRKADFAQWEEELPASTHQIVSLFIL